MATPSKAKKTKEKEEEQLPSIEEAKAIAEEVFAPLESEYLQSFLSRLQVLANKPPQVLLFEGGNQKTRIAVAKYWAALINCSNQKQVTTNIGDEMGLAPCLSCVNCIEIANEIAPDFKLFNGLLESIKIDQMRELKPLISTKPFQFKQRMVLFHEASAFIEEAANAILKILEEPNSTTSFIFTLAIRELILPTLVSRANIMILPTVTQTQVSSEESKMADDVFTFLSKGQLWFVNHSSKKDFNKEKALYIINIIEFYLVKALEHFSTQKAKEQEQNEHALTIFFMEKLDVKHLQIIMNILEEAQISLMELETPVNPALVIDTMLIQIYMLLNQ